MFPPNITPTATALSLAIIPFVFGYHFCRVNPRLPVQAGRRLKSSQMNATHIIVNGPCEEAPIVVALRSGDPAAFDQIFEQFYSALYNFIFHYIKDEACAQDLVSDTFEKLWVERGQIQGPGIAQIKHFLLKTARNRCFDEYRKRALQKRYETTCLHNQVVSDPCNLQREIWLLVLQEVDCLEKQFAEVLKLYYVELMSYPAIATRLGISEVAARRRKCRAVQLLRARFEGKAATDVVYW